MLEVCKELRAERLRGDFSGRRRRRQPRPRRVRPRPAARHAAGHHHARQQRDGRDLSHRAALAADQGDRSGDRLPHRRDAIGGQVPIDLQREFQHVDLLSFSGHKLHAPKGIGVLYIKRGTPCRPFMIGGHQEEGRRAGTENVPYIVGLAKALELAAENYQDEETRVRSLRDRLEKAIEERIPNVQVNGQGAPRLPNTLNVSCHYVEGEGMLYQLSDFGICASSGSACTSGSLEPSHVLRAMKVPFTAVHGSVRFSFSRYNTDEDVDRIIEVFPEIVANLRRLSPYWDQEKNAPRPGAENLVIHVKKN